jgi:hypothetical protein
MKGVLGCEVLGAGDGVGFKTPLATLHKFQGRADFGSELDLVASWSVNQCWGLHFKYANFSTDNASRYSDTPKAWLTVNFKI